MSYPATIDSYTTLVDYQQSFSETLTLAASPVSFLITTSHDILSTVTFSAIYGTEVSATPVAGQFRPLYGTNQIELGPLSSPSTITLSYLCAGDVIQAIHVNELQAAVTNTETVLGLTPQGSYTDVATRLNALSTSAGLVPASQDFTSLCNGATKVFTLSFSPKYPEAVWVFVNGLRARPNVHYMVSGSDIVFITADAPKSTDELLVDYFR